MSSSKTTVDQAPVFTAAASIHRQDSLVIVPLVRIIYKKGSTF